MINLLLSIALLKKKHIFPKCYFCISYLKYHPSLLLCFFVHFHLIVKTITFSYNNNNDNKATRLSTHRHLMLKDSPSLASRRHPSKLEAWMTVSFWKEAVNLKHNHGENAITIFNWLLQCRETTELADGFTRVKRLSQRRCVQYW